MNFKMVFHTIGNILKIEALLLILPLIVSLIYREGTFETFLNPQNHLFIRIVTEDETYYISGVDDAQTQIIIEELEGSAN